MEWAEKYIGGKGLLLRYMWEEIPPGLDPWSEDNPVFIVTGPFAGTNVSTVVAAHRRLQEPGDGRAQRQLRRRLVRARAQVRRLRHDHREGPRRSADGHHDQGRRGRVPARPAQVLGHEDVRDRAGHARRLRPARQDPLHRPGRREEAPVGLRLDRPVPQGRTRRSRRPPGRQEPQGDRRSAAPARCRSATPRRSSPTSGASTTSTSSPTTTTGSTRRARRSSSTSSTAPARCPRATGPRASSRTPATSTRSRSRRSAPRSAPATSAPSPAATSTPWNRTA